MIYPRQVLTLVLMALCSLFAVGRDALGGDYVWARSAWGNGSWGRNYGGMSNGYGGYYVPRNAYGNNYEARGSFRNPNGYIIPAQPVTKAVPPHCKVPLVSGQSLPAQVPPVQVSNLPPTTSTAGTASTNAAVSAPVGPATVK